MGITRITFILWATVNSIIYKTVPSAGFMIASCSNVAMHPAAPVNQQKYHDDSHNTPYNNTIKITILHTSENCTIC